MCVCVCVCVRACMYIYFLESKIRIMDHSEILFSTLMCMQDIYVNSLNLFSALGDNVCSHILSHYA
jgi:hypothetical protein